MKRRSNSLLNKFPITKWVFSIFLYAHVIQLEREQRDPLSASKGSRCDHHPALPFTYSAKRKSYKRKSGGSGMEGLTDFPPFWKYLPSFCCLVSQMERRGNYFSYGQNWKDSIILTDDKHPHFFLLLISCKYTTSFSF